MQPQTQANMSAIAKAMLEASEKPQRANRFKRGEGTCTLKKLLKTDGGSYVFEVEINTSNALPNAFNEQPNAPGELVGSVFSTTSKFAWQNITQAVTAFANATVSDFINDAKESKYKADKIAKGVLGPNAPWDHGHEFEAFLEDMIATNGLAGRQARYRTGNPDRRAAVGKDDKDGAPIFPSFYALPKPPTK